jgi:hypothetical protein
MDFWSTVRGVHLAEIVTRELPKLVKELKRANDLKEKELEAKQEDEKNGEV